LREFDTAFVVMAWMANFNIRRLERFLAQCWNQVQVDSLF